MSDVESPASFGGIALDALEAARKAQAKADQVERDINSHEDICAERYKNINEKVGTLFKLVAYGGSTALMLILGLLGFLAKAQFDSITELKSAAVQRADIREQLLRSDQPPQVIIQPAQGSTGMGATVERKPEGR